jgi:superfamily II DNA/RNA helicase
MHGHGHELKKKIADVHRLGRTARAGQSGEGHLILDPVEKRFVSQLAQTTTITELPLTSLAGSDQKKWQMAVNNVLDTDAGIHEMKGKTYVVSLL